MFKALASAAVVASLLAFSPSFANAAAAPGLAAKPAAETGVVQVQNRDRVRRKQIRRRSYNRGFRAGQRYRSAPRGWRRYDRRPRDWRTRGCIIVGPIWFCP
jgi:Ni/Co efflux regulator RcnB